MSRSIGQDSLLNSIERASSGSDSEGSTEGRKQRDSLDNSRHFGKDDGVLPPARPVLWQRDRRCLTVALFFPGVWGSASRARRRVCWVLLVIGCSFLLLDVLRPLFTRFASAVVFAQEEEVVVVRRCSHDGPSDSPAEHVPIHRWALAIAAGLPASPAF